MLEDVNNPKIWNQKLRGIEFPCKIELISTPLPVYAGGGYEYVKVEFLSYDDYPEIVEIREDKESRLWGRLKSGAGWVPLSETKIVTNNRTQEVM